MPSSAPPPSRRQKAGHLYQEPRLPRAWGVTVIGLTLFSLVLVAVDEIYVERANVHRALRWLDAAICAVFIADFGWRYNKAKSRREFVRRNWIDLLGSIPAIDVLRTIRLVRVVRIVRLLRVAPKWQRYLKRFDVPLPPGPVINLLVSLIVIWVLSAAAFFQLERKANKSIETFSDALWWSMTTLSTVGYGDLYPSTSGGRVVAVFTMILGIGLLGAVAATVATAFIEVRDRGKRGLRSYDMRDHLLVLGWNEKSHTSIDNFLNDVRHEATDIVIVAPRGENPMDDQRVRFVKGDPARLKTLRKASAQAAGGAVVFARDPNDPRSDHENALIVTSLRRLNAEIRIAVELVASDNREHLSYAGCDAIIDKTSTIAKLLARSVQDIGVSDVVTELLSSKYGSELYRIPIDAQWVGKPFRDYAVAMLEESISVIGLVHGDKTKMNPEPDTTISEAHDAFVVAREPPV